MKPKAQYVILGLHPHTNHVHHGNKLTQPYKNEYFLNGYCSLTLNTNGSNLYSFCSLGYILLYNGLSSTQIF